jgi:PAS domain-containing protein
MENELSRVLDTLPALVWTALPDGHVDFLNQRWCEYTGLSVDEAYGPGWQTAIHPKTCLRCSNAGDPFWLLASRVKWKRACGASMESVSLVRLPYSSASRRIRTDRQMVRK